MTNSTSSQDQSIEALLSGCEAAADRREKAREAYASARGDVLHGAYQAYRRQAENETAREELASLCAERGTALRPPDDPAVAIVLGWGACDMDEAADYATIVRFAYLKGMGERAFESIADYIWDDWNQHVAEIRERFEHEFPSEYREWNARLEELLSYYDP